MWLIHFNQFFLSSCFSSRYIFNISQSRGKDILTDFRGAGGSGHGWGMGEGSIVEIHADSHHVLFLILGNLAECRC